MICSISFCSVKESEIDIFIVSAIQMLGLYLILF
jgi:hypothetical protein